MAINCYIMNADADVQLTKHFKVKEFACKDGTPIVFIDNRLYCILDNLRYKVKKPIIINSGYRTPKHNAKVGGTKYSYHMRGMAADIRVDGMSPKELAKELNEMIPDKYGIIVYKSWVHFDVRDGKYRKGI